MALLGIRYSLKVFIISRFHNLNAKGYVDGLISRISQARSAKLVSGQAGN